MTWDALGAGAELIGAIVVFITLIYIAVQTRDNAKVQKARAVWDAQVSFVEVNDLLGDGGTVSELMYRSLSEPNSLSEYELYLAHRFTRGWFQRMEAQFALFKAGILEEEIWELRRGYANAILENAVIRGAWEMDKSNSMFTQGFIESIDGTAKTDIPGFLGIGSISGR